MPELDASDVSETPNAAVQWVQQDGKASSGGFLDPRGLVQFRSGTQTPANDTGDGAGRDSRDLPDQEAVALKGETECLMVYTSGIG